MGKSRRRVVILLVLFFAITAVSGVFFTLTTYAGKAADFLVDTTADTHDMNAGDGVCADPSGDCSLRAAIEEANALSVTTESIQMPAGVFLLSAGQITISDDLILTGSGMTATVVDGQGLDRIFQVDRPAVTNAATVLISGLTIQNGQSGSSGGAIWNDERLHLTNIAVQASHAVDLGGGIYSQGSLTMTQSLVQNNGAANGAGLFHEFIYTTNRIESSTFSGNLAGTGSGQSGGGLYLSDGNWTIIDTTVANNTANDGAGLRLGSGNVWIEGSTITGNTGSGSLAEGGGIYNHSDLTIVDSTISLNSASQGGGLLNQILGNTVISGTQIISNSTPGGGAGGGIYSAASSSPTSVTVFQSRIAGNASGIGGGLYLSGSLSTVRLTEVAIENNQAAANGGGILMSINSGSLTIDRSTISGNITAQDGGGFARFANSGGLTTIQNSTFSANQANGSGGGIFYDTFGSGSLKIQSTTIAYNLADADGFGGGDGGGIFDDTSGSSLKLKSTIIGANTDPGGQAPDCGGSGSSSIDTQGSNLIENLTGCHLTPIPSDITGVSPNLGPLQNNGGQTLTHALLTGSPAIDSSTCLDINGLPVPTDQRGVSRPQGATCDRGAFEYEGSTATPTPTASATATQTPSPTATSTMTPSATPTGVPANSIYLPLAIREDGSG